MDYALSLVGEHWKQGLFWILGLLAFIPGIMYAAYKWRQRIFTHLLNSSLNFRHDDGHFAFATLDEEPVATLFGSYAQIRLMHLARQKTAFLHFGSADEAWQFLNCVLNHLSSKFGEGALWYGMGLGVKTELVFGITCERHDELKTRKFRVMLASPALLAEIHAGLTPRYEDSRHDGMRGETLKEMAAIWHDPARKHNLRTITIYLKRD
ncbi:MAG: hypothetical protein KBC95_02415 [Candidatus Peribacteraceae bacterium]|nr:hypothetical protein [Candidatus Peribacteraceae bacterium]